MFFWNMSVSRLLKIPPHNRDQVLGRLELRRLDLVGRCQHMKSNMPFDEVGHEAIHGAAAGGDKLEYLLCVALTLQRTFNCFDLPLDAVNSCQLFF
jgi:hypothetical protein